MTKIRKALSSGKAGSVLLKTGSLFLVVLVCAPATGHAGVSPTFMLIRQGERTEATPPARNQTCPSQSPRRGPRNPTPNRNTPKGLDKTAQGQRSATLGKWENGKMKMENGKTGKQENGKTGKRENRNPESPIPQSEYPEGIKQTSSESV